MHSITRYLETILKLKVNLAKSKVAPMSECSFLGFTIKGKKIRWTDKALANFKHRVKHSPQAGHLAVRLVADAHHAALTVADSGPGIGADLQTRLFQPFSAGSMHSGSGLGLLICREIAQALGGSITLENRELHGKVIGLDATVRLPLVQNIAY